MTKSEFLAAGDCEVTFKGVGPFFLVCKDPGFFHAPLCRPGEYENLEIPFAHAYYSGEIMRFGEVIGNISDLEFVKNTAAIMEIEK